MQVESITSLEDIPFHAVRWDELAAMSPRDGLFRSSAWYLAWMKHIRPDAIPHVLLIRDHDGRIAGIAPLCRASHRDLGFSLDSLRWAGREAVSGEFLGVAAVPHLEDEVHEAVLRYLLDSGIDWNVLVLSDIFQDGALHKTALRLVHGRQLKTMLQEPRACPYIELPCAYDEYLSKLESSTRDLIGRRLRDVAELDATIQTISGPAEVASHLPDLIRLHSARWWAEKLRGTLARPGFAEFLREVCMNPPPGSSSRLYMLVHNGSPAGALLAFHTGQSSFYYQAGWNPVSEVLSPAFVLIAHSIRDAIEQGKRYYEFLRGDEACTSQWTTTARYAATFIVGRGWMANRYFRLARLKDTLNHVLATRNPSTAAASEESAVAEEVQL